MWITLEYIKSRTVWFVILVPLCFTIYENYLLFLATRDTLKLEHQKLWWNSRKIFLKCPQIIALKLIKLLILDRDGVLNKVVMRGEIKSSPRTLKELEMPDDHKKIKLILKEINLKIVVATNQPTFQEIC